MIVIFRYFLKQGKVMVTMAILLLTRLPSLRKGALWFLLTPHRTALEWVSTVDVLLLKKVLRVDQ